MHRLSTYLRMNNNLARMIRGPKKKKEAQIKIESNDIVNIYKDKTDPQIKPIEEYPVYVQQFSLGDHSFYQISSGIQLNLGYKIPNRSTYKAFLGGMKKQRVLFYSDYAHFDKKINIHNERHDPNNRRILVNIYAKSQEDLAEEEKKRLQQQAAMDDQQDQ